MDELIGRLTSAAGIDAEQAKRAVEIILGFLKKEGPPGAVEAMLDKLPGAHEALAAAGSGGGGGLMGMMGGLMGGGGGIMALGGQLMGEGLSMGQIQDVGRELIAYGREKAGEDTMGEIVGAIPGLGQFL